MGIIRQIYVDIFLLIFIVKSVGKGLDLDPSISFKQLLRQALNYTLEYRSTHQPIYLCSKPYPGLTFILFRHS